MNKMPLIRRMTLSTAAHQYRDYGMELYKKYYLDKESCVRRICPQNFDLDRWSKMVDYWDSPEWQGKSGKNKVIRAKQMMGHTSGSKSYARARKDYKKLRGGFHNPLSFFRFTHTRKDNSWIDEPSQDKWVFMDKFPSISN